MDEKHFKPKYFPIDLIEQAEIVLKAWVKYKDLIPLGGESPANFKSQLSKIKDLEEKVGNLQKQIDELREIIPSEKRELFEVIQKVRNSARAAFGLRDTRLAEFGLNPSARRGRPPKNKMGKQLGLELPKDFIKTKTGGIPTQESKEKIPPEENQKSQGNTKITQEESSKSHKEQSTPIKEDPLQGA